MTRSAETAALHGHPTVAEDNAKIIELQRRFPTWQVDRCPHGFEASHRTESPNLRTQRIGIQTRLRHSELSNLEEALLVQQALRGEGPEAVR